MNKENKKQNNKNYPIQLDLIPLETGKLRTLEMRDKMFADLYILLQGLMKLNIKPEEKLIIEKILPNMKFTIENQTDISIESKSILDKREYLKENKSKPSVFYVMSDDDAEGFVTLFKSLYSEFSGRNQVLIDEVIQELELSLINLL
ncbi:hypothetical protein [Priestia aryabhattai]